MDIESLERKMKENTHSIQDIYLIISLLFLFTMFICIYLMFDKTYNNTNESNIHIKFSYV
uniref:Uncharacterized protein n=1 Tax=viral metagenome TaxID=1070528 RepID=A0A6C0CSV2_9ZZZZ